MYKRVTKKTGDNLNEIVMPFRISPYDRSKPYKKGKRGILTSK
ncbi:hypothetical protein [Methanobrevibacter sp.]